MSTWLIALPAVAAVFLAVRALIRRRGGPALRWLLVANIAMGAGAVVGTAEDEVDFWETFGCTGGLVYVVAAKVAGIVDGFLDGEGGEVLVAEGWNG